MAPCAIALQELINLCYEYSIFFKGRFYYKINKTQHKKLQLFTKYVQTHHHKDFKHCTS